MIRVAVGDQHRADVAGGEALRLQLAEDRRPRRVHAGVDEDGAVLRPHDPGVGAAGLDADDAGARVDPRPVGRLTRGEQEAEQQDGQEQDAAEPDERALQDLLHGPVGKADQTSAGCSMARITAS